MTFDATKYQNLDWGGSAQPQTPAAPPKKKGLLGSLSSLVNGITQPIIRGGKAVDTLGDIPRVLGYNLTHKKDIPLSRATADIKKNVDPTQLAKDTVSTGLTFSPLAATKGAGFLAKAAQGAKIGSLAGGAQGAVNEIGSDNPGDYLGAATKGAIAGGLTGGALGGASGVISKVTGRGSGARNGLEPTEGLKQAQGKGTPNGVLGKAKRTLATQGQQMEARSGGYETGAKVPGSKDLGFGASSDIGKVLQDEGISTGNPISRQRSAEEKLSGYGSQIDDTLNEANRPLSASEKKSISNDIKQSVEKAGVDDTVRGHAQQLVDNFNTQVKDVKDLVNFRRQLDQDNISYISNPDAATAAKQQAAINARGVVSDATGKIVPEIKDLNSKYHKLSNANEYLIKGAKNVNNASGGVIGRVANSGPVQAAESKVGRLLYKASGEAPDTAVAPDLTAPTTVPKPPGVVGTLIDDASRAPATGALVADAQQQEPGSDNAAPLAPLVPQDMPTDTSDNSDTNSMYSKANMMADIQRDPKHIDQYLALYKELNPESSGPKPLSSTAATQVANAQSGLRAIDQLQGMLGETNKNAIASKLGGNLGRNIAGTQDFDAAKNEIIDVISRTRSGAALSKDEINNYKRALPSFGDSPEVAQQKLDRFRQLFGSVLQSEQAGSPDIESATQ